MPVSYESTAPTPEEVGRLAVGISKGLVGNTNSEEHQPVQDGVMHGPYMPTENPYEQHDRQFEAAREAYDNPDMGKFGFSEAQVIGKEIRKASDKIGNEIENGDYRNLAQPAREALEAKDIEERRN